MSNKRDYYDVVGVSKNANDKEIKKAYRKKAMLLHPDKYKGPKEEAEEKFKELNEAYSVLSDERQRRRYDQFGHAGVEGAASGARGADPFDFFSSIFDFDLSDLFGGGFGGRRARPRGPQRGEDVVLELELSFEEAFEGVSKKIKMPYNTPCKTCNGTRSEPGSSYKTCNYCRGSGIVEKQEQRGFFVQISRQPCSTCNGSGKIPEKKCKPCKGSGKSPNREEIKIKIPRGINENEAVRVQGKGRPSNSGGMPGDLIFRIHLKKHAIFERSGNDVYMKLKVNYPTMVLGGAVDVPLISGKENQRTGQLKIPSGTNLNDYLKLKNEGFVKDVRGNTDKGDSYYVIDLMVPKKISKEEKQLLKDLKDKMN